MKFITPNPALIVENNLPSTGVKQIDEIEAIETSVDTNIGKDVTIPKDVMDSFKLKDELNPEIWPDGKLDPEIQPKLIKIANGFLKDLNLGKGYKIKDIIFTGSLANYNWSKFSDIDLHVVLDYDQFDGDPQMIEDYFWSQKALWNNEHDIKIKGYPVEIYAQNSKEKLDATAVYSVLKNKWVLKPNKEKFNLDKGVIRRRAQQYIDQLKAIRSEYTDKHYDTVIDWTTKLGDKIRQMRKAGLENGGEFSLENLVFKVLRRTPFMDILSSYKIKAYDEKMTVSEYSSALDEGDVLDQTKFNYEEDEDNVSIEAHYNGKLIATLSMVQVMDGHWKFEPEISDVEYMKLFPEDKFMEIDHLRVWDKTVRGEGIAKKLMQLGLKKGQELGYDTFYLNASPMGSDGLNHADLVGFYKSFGFETFLPQRNNSLMILHLNQPLTETESQTPKKGGVLFILGEKLEGGQQRLYVTTIKDLLSLNRKKVDNMDGQSANMAVFSGNRVFRVGMDDQKKIKAFTVAWGSDSVMLKKLGLTKTSVTLNNNKTPLHWESTKTNNVVQAVNQMSSELQNIPNIKWVG